MFLALKSCEIDGIEVTGQDRFRARTKAALELLKPRPCFAEVRESIAVIREGRRSAMWVRKAKPTFVVGAPTWRHSALWYAGAIAHDAYHAKLYRDAREKNNGNEPDAEEWTGSEAEKKCLAFQRDVLQQLGADPETLAYIERCARNPSYQGSNRGLRGWLDYLRRGW